MVELYTTLDDPETEEKINKIIEAIKDKIVKRFHPKSIILKGSFGRGEITVLKAEKLRFLSDCEIVVIQDKRIRRGELLKLSREISQEMELDVQITDIESELKFCVFLNLWNRILPTIDNYELKYGSKVIYGENFLEQLPNFKAEEVPIWEGIRLMFNRIIESLSYFSIKYLDKYPTEDEERKLFYWINKILLACQDALLISGKKYHYSYQIRNGIFQEIFPKYFLILNEQIPDFLPLTIKATEYKLNPQKMYSKNVVTFWFDVAEIVDKVFRYIIKDDMRIEFDSYDEFQERYLKHPLIRRKYYRGLSPNLVYQNLRSGVKMCIFHHNFPQHRFMAKIMTPWSHLIYSSIPLVYFSLSRNMAVDELQLKIARNNLSLIKYADQNIHDDWEYVAKQTFNKWRTICY